MATQIATEETSIMELLRTEARERPVRLVSLTLFLLAVSFMLPYAEVHDGSESVGAISMSAGDAAAVTDSPICVLAGNEKPSHGGVRTTADTMCRMP